MIPYLPSVSRRVSERSRGISGTLSPGVYTASAGVKPAGRASRRGHPREGRDKKGARNGQKVQNTMNINAKIRRFLPLLPALAAALLCCACGNSDSGADAAYEESILAEAMDYDLDPVPGGGEEAEVLTLTLSAAGDCTLGTTQSQSYSGSFTDYYDSYGESWFFDGVRDIFSADDFTLVNLECVLTEETSRVDKTFNLKGKPEYTGILLDGSVEGVSLGNNHTMDYGLQSLCDTEDALSEAEIVYGYNDSTWIFTAENGLTVGVVSANLLDETETQENYIRNGIESLREQGVNLIVACCHWGIEKEYYPTDYQIEAAHRIVDWGADLVVGCHPHELEGNE